MKLVPLEIFLCEQGLYLQLDTDYSLARYQELACESIHLLLKLRRKLRPRIERERASL